MEIDGFFGIEYHSFFWIDAQQKKFQGAQADGIVEIPSSPVCKIICLTQLFCMFCGDHRHFI